MSVLVKRKAEDSDLLASTHHHDRPLLKRRETSHTHPIPSLVLQWPRLPRCDEDQREFRPSRAVDLTPTHHYAVHFPTPPPSAELHPNPHMTLEHHHHNHHSDLNNNNYNNNYAHNNYAHNNPMTSPPSPPSISSYLNHHILPLLTTFHTHLTTFTNQQTPTLTTYHTHLHHCRTHLDSLQHAALKQVRVRADLAHMGVGSDILAAIDREVLARLDARIGALRAGVAGLEVELEAVEVEVDRVGGMMR